jgi:hypothetical protein
VRSKIQTAELITVKARGAYSYHWALEDQADSIGWQVNFHSWAILIAYTVMTYY